MVEIQTCTYENLLKAIVCNDLTKARYIFHRKSFFLLAGVPSSELSKLLVVLTKNFIFSSVKKRNEFLEIVQLCQTYIPQLYCDIEEWTILRKNRRVFKKTVLRSGKTLDNIIETLKKIPCLTITPILIENCEFGRIPPAG